MFYKKVNGGNTEACTGNYLSKYYAKKEKPSLLRVSPD